MFTLCVCICVCFWPSADCAVCLQWHSLSREEQAKYYELSRKERQLHSQLYPGWSARDNYVSQTVWAHVNTHSLTLTFVCCQTPLSFSTVQLAFTCCSCKAVETQMCYTSNIYTPPSRKNSFTDIHLISYIIILKNLFYIDPCREKIFL